MRAVVALTSTAGAGAMRQYSDSLLNLASAPDMPNPLAAQPNQNNHAEHPPRGPNIGNPMGSFLEFGNSMPMPSFLDDGTDSLLRSAQNNFRHPVEPSLRRQPTNAPSAEELMALHRRDSAEKQDFAHAIHANAKVEEMSLVDLLKSAFMSAYLLLYKIGSAILTMFRTVGMAVMSSSTAVVSYAFDNFSMRTYVHEDINVQVMRGFGFALGALTAIGFCFVVVNYFHLDWLQPIQSDSRPALTFATTKNDKVNVQAYGSYSNGVPTPRRWPAARSAPQCKAVPTLHGLSHGNLDAPEVFVDDPYRVAEPDALDEAARLVEEAEEIRIQSRRASSECREAGLIFSARGKGRIFDQMPRKGPVTVADSDYGCDYDDSVVQGVAVDHAFDCVSDDSSISGLQNVGRELEGLRNFRPRGSRGSNTTTSHYQARLNAKNVSKVGGHGKKKSKVRKPQAGAQWFHA